MRTDCIKKEKLFTIYSKPLCNAH